MLILVGLTSLIIGILIGIIIGFLIGRNLYELNHMGIRKHAKIKL